ncbi:MAG TPA: MFS transporter [Stellaceae bacterium]|nr:MFS transporter [Stellaceae bacterium]
MRALRLNPIAASPLAAAVGPRALLGTPNYLRLWLAGAVGNGMRWLELLVAGIFTYDLTHSTLAVAVVTVARTLPMLFMGALAGAVGEAANRKAVLVGQLVLLAATSASLGYLALRGALTVAAIVAGGAVSGMAWAAEMSVRRRMIGEAVPPVQAGPAIALDTLTGSVTRMLGPLLGGALYQTLGIGGAYLLSAALYGAAALAVLGLDLRQEKRRLNFGRLPADIAEGLAVARRNPVILGVILVTIITNFFGFCYATLIPPIGLHEYRVSPVWVGMLAAAEPVGATLSGILFSIGALALDRRDAMLRGSFLFLAGLVVMALAPWYWLAFCVLCLTGLGTAVFSIKQTTLILDEAPSPMRSRVMGLVTVCIGTGPIGTLLIGALALWCGASLAILAMAGLGLLGLTLVGLYLAAFRRRLM